MVLNQSTVTTYNTPGFSKFNWNAGSAWSFTSWTNGTAMYSSHHFVLILSVYLSVQSWVSGYNLKGAWAAHASSSINMATLGNGAKLNSITVR